MTYVQAQMIVHNPEAYAQDQVHKAAALILADLYASDDDVFAAMAAI